MLVFISRMASSEICEKLLQYMDNALLHSTADCSMVLLWELSGRLRSEPGESIIFWHFMFFLQNIPKNWVLLRRTEPEIHFGDYYFYIIDVICIFVISLNPDLTTPLGLILKRFLFAFLKFFNQVTLVNLNKIYKKKTLKFTDDNEIDFWRVSSESVFFRHGELHEIILDLSL